MQSEIASESPGILDVFRDGAIRLVEVSNKGRLIPIYSLLPPTIAYGVIKYLFTLAVRGATSRIMQIRQKQSQELRVSCRLLTKKPFVFKIFDGTHIKHSVHMLYPGCV